MFQAQSNPHVKKIIYMFQDVKFNHNMRFTSAIMYVFTQTPQWKGIVSLKIGLLI